ncbi:TPA: mechanosensitive ion channel family protein [Vibrio alginolyticus]|nr:mechanosensitive ion channel family protein [Vibrio sp. Vb0667]MDW3633411.1 mechanosensitive ion channel family protein [Vibrio sp. Vb0667]
MNDWIQLEQVSQYFTTGSLGYKLLMGIFVLIAYRILKRIVNRAILNLATTKGVKKARLSFIQRCFNVALLFLTASIFAIITGIGYGDVSLFLSSIFAVLGVAFIAQWSILSNITASFLIFFVFPYRVGDRIKVVDKDEDICGEIQEISMFHVLIKHDNGNLITYPNNQILQKAVLKLAKNKPEPSKAKSRIYTRRKKYDPS